MNYNIQYKVTKYAQKSIEESNEMVSLPTCLYKLYNHTYLPNF